MPGMPLPKMFLVESVIQHLGLKIEQDKIRTTVQKTQKELSPRGSRLDLLFIDDATPRVGDHPKLALVESCLRHLGVTPSKPDLKKATSEARKALIEKAGVDSRRVRPKLIATIS